MGGGNLQIYVVHGSRKVVEYSPFVWAGENKRWYTPSSFPAVSCVTYRQTFLQATNGNSGERKIEVEVRFLRNEGGGNYMVVRDNGRGMDKKGLEAFATYHLSQVGGHPVSIVLTCILD